MCVVPVTQNLIFSLSLSLFLCVSASQNKQNPPPPFDLYSAPIPQLCGCGGFPLLWRLCSLCVLSLLLFFFLSFFLFRVFMEFPCALPPHPFTSHCCFSSCCLSPQFISASLSLSLKFPSFGEKENNGSALRMGLPFVGLT